MCIFCTIIDMCVNARDIFGVNECDKQVDIYNQSCVNFLETKDCDKKCNLCACSTSVRHHIEHCSGNGVCEANCNQKRCIWDRCKCNDGFLGDKCQANGMFNVIIIVYFKLFQIRGLYLSINEPLFMD